MIAIRPNLLVGELQETLKDVEVTTGGYLTEERLIKCDFLEKVGNSRFGEKIDFYSDGKGNILTFHYGPSLSLRKKVLAIDFFPGVDESKITKVLDSVMHEIRNRRSGNA